jgi:hypothetical protein
MTPFRSAKIAAMGSKSNLMRLIPACLRRSKRRRYQAALMNGADSIVPFRALRLALAKSIHPLISRMAPMLRGKFLIATAYAWQLIAFAHGPIRDVVGHD